MLSDLLEPNGELLPLACPDGEYFAFNVTTLPDLLNGEQSRLLRLPTGRILDIDEYKFRPARILPPIFKLPQIPTLWVFVNEAFVERVTANGLQGFDFSLIWKDGHHAV